MRSSPNLTPAAVDAVDILMYLKVETLIKMSCILIPLLRQFYFILFFSHFAGKKDRNQISWVLLWDIFLCSLRPLFHTNSFGWTSHLFAAGALIQYRRAARQRSRKHRATQSTCLYFLKQWSRMCRKKTMQTFMDDGRKYFLFIQIFNLTFLKYYSEKSIFHFCPISHFDRQQWTNNGLHLKNVINVLFTTLRLQWCYVVMCFICFKMCRCSQMDHYWPFILLIPLESMESCKLHINVLFSTQKSEAFRKNLSSSSSFFLCMHICFSSPSIKKII